MNCPNCKNPINDNATICEWCGETISSIKTLSEKDDFSMIVTNAYLIGGTDINNLTFFGRIVRGCIKSDDTFELICQGNKSIIGICKGTMIGNAWKGFKYFPNGEAKVGETLGIVSNISRRELGLGRLTYKRFDAKIVKPINNE